MSTLVDREPDTLRRPAHQCRPKRAQFGNRGDRLGLRAGDRDRGAMKTR